MKTPLKLSIAACLAAFAAMHALSAASLTYTTGSAFPTMLGYLGTGDTLIISGSSGQITLSNGSVLTVSDWAEVNNNGSINFAAKDNLTFKAASGYADQWAVLQMTVENRMLSLTPLVPTATGTSTLKFEKIIITGAYAKGGGSGGAINFSGGADVALIMDGDIAFVANKGYQGGGGFAPPGSLTFTGTAIFDSNIAGYNGVGKALGGYSGGGYSATNNATATGIPVVTFQKEALFYGNVAGDQGGGMWANSGVQIAFKKDAVFASNTSYLGEGGGLYLRASTDASGTGIITFSGSATFQANKGGTHGGGLFLGNRATAIFNSSAQFIGNVGSAMRTGGQGGGFYAGNNTTVRFNGATLFKDNITYGTYGGGFVLGTASDAVFAAPVVFEGNKASGRFYLNATTANPTFTNADFQADAAFGGGAYINNANTKVVFSSTATFHKNTSIQWGGGLYVKGPAEIVFDNTAIFTENQAAGVLTGTTVEIKGSGSLQYNGQTYVPYDTTIILSTTLVRNYAADGGGLALDNAVNIKFNKDLRFEKNSASRRGGGMVINGAATPQFNGNVEFINNRSGAGGGGLYSDVSLLFGTGDGSLMVKFKDNFTGNTGADGNTPSTSSEGGGLWTGADLTIGRKFEIAGNQTLGLGGGVAVRRNISISASGTFGNNIALNRGGAIYMSGSGVSLAIGSGVSFINNISGGDGGAIYLSDVTSLSLAAAASDIVFSGNKSGATIDYSAVADGGKLTASGGVANAIHYAKSGTLTVDAQAGRGVYFYDPVKMAAGGTLTFEKTGAGTVLFSQWTSDVVADTAIRSGTLRLADGAVLGASNAEGSFTLAAGAALAGSGLIRAGSASIGDDAIIEVSEGRLGIDASGIVTIGERLRLAGSGTLALGARVNASSINIGVTGTRGTLTINGDLALNNSTVYIDLFSDGLSDQLIATGNVTIAGSNVLDINAFMTGTYNIGNLLGLSGTTVKIGGASQAEGARQTAVLINDGTNLLLVAGADISRTLTWTGMESAELDTTGTNWTGSNLTRKFASGDRVIFGDGGNGGSITIGGLGANVSEMRVEGSKNYTFTGPVGINAATRYIITVGGINDVAGASGKLIKSGTGTLSFENTANNMFSGGIEIAGGAVSFTHAGQLGDGGSGIVFSGTGTLRNANAGATGMLVNNIHVNAASRGILDLGSMRLSGTLFSGDGTAALRKMGSGTVALSADSSTFSGSLSVAEGMLELNGAKLGGSTIISNGAKFGGVGEVTGRVDAQQGSTLLVGGGLLRIADLVLPNGALVAGSGTLGGVAKIGAVAGDVVTYDVNGQLVVDALTSGLGKVVKTGSGALIYTGLPSIGYTGGTEICGGVVMLRGITGADAQNLAHSFLLNGGWLDLSDTDYGSAMNEWGRLSITGSVGGVIGSNDLIKIGAGQTAFDIGNTTKAGVFVVVDAGDGVATMTGSNNYAGYTKLVSGTLKISADNQLGDVALRREVRMEGGSLQIAADGFRTDRALELYNTGTGWFSVDANVTATWAGNISGAGALKKSGAGTLVLTGSNNHAGGTQILSGTLRGSSAGLHGNITNEAALVFDQADTGAFAGNVSGTTGKVYKVGAGRLTVSGSIEAAAMEINGGDFILSQGARVTTVENLLVGSGGAIGGLGTVRAPVIRNFGNIKVGKAGGAANYGTLTLDGDYLGAGTVTLAVVLQDGVAVMSDTLRITGSASGQSLISLVTTATTGVAGTATALVHAVKGSTGDAFALDRRYVSGAYELTLEYQIGNNWAVVAKDASPEIPSAFGVDSVAILAGKAALGSLGDRLMVVRADGASHKGELWMNGMHHQDRINSSLYDGAKSNSQGVQTGVDWYKKTDAGSVAVGLFYDYSKSDMDLVGGLSTASVQAHAGGMYVSWQKGKWYFDLLGRAASESYQMTVPETPTSETKGRSLAIAATVGYALNIGRNWVLEPLAQAMFQSHRINDFTDAMGRLCEIDSADSMEGKVGARIRKNFDWTPGQKMTVYMRTSYVYEFRGCGKIEVAGASFGNDLGGSGGEVDVGMAMHLDKHWDLNLSGGAYSGARSEGYNLNLGFGYGW